MQGWEHLMIDSLNKFEGLSLENVINSPALEIYEQFFAKDLLKNFR